jgi:hypothetical protein
MCDVPDVWLCPTSTGGVMANARVTILRRWPDGDVLQISVSAATSYPDAIAEAKRTALDAYAEALGVTLADVDEP